jgi:hypothetical protein
MNLSKEQTDLLQSFCDEYDYEFRTDYSGRGMYGKTCIGFVIDSSPFIVALTLAQFCYENDSDVIEFLHQEGCCQDSMGHNTIIYFPSIQAHKQDNT